MKRLLSTVILILVLITGCSTNDTVTITADRDSYTPLMSSAQGITLTPNFETKMNYKNLVYHWETSEGEFIGIGKEVNNQGEAVLWSAVENDKVTDIKKDFDINLEVIDGESNKVLASTKLTITPNNGFYEIKK